MLPSFSPDFGGFPDPFSRKRTSTGPDQVWKSVVVYLSTATPFAGSSPTLLFSPKSLSHPEVGSGSPGRPELTQDNDMGELFLPYDFLVLWLTHDDKHFISRLVQQLERASSSSAAGVVALRYGEAVHLLGGFRLRPNPPPRLQHIIFGYK